MRNKEWENKWKKDLDFWFSDFGKELQLNAVAQGYEQNLFNIMMCLFGSGFTAIKIIIKLREDVRIS